MTPENIKVCQKIPSDPRLSICLLGYQFTNQLIYDSMTNYK